MEIHEGKGGIGFIFAASLGCATHHLNGSSSLEYKYWDFSCHIDRIMTWMWSDREGVCIQF